MKAQQCVQLTSTNRPFGLSIELTLRSRAFNPGLVCHPEVRAFERVAEGPIDFVSLPRAGLAEALSCDASLPTWSEEETVRTPRPREKPPARRRSTSGRTRSFAQNAQDFGSGLGRPLERLRFAGDLTARVPPVPIPNTEVKPRWADGTARESVWEIR